jgi:hypothetical protein
MGKKESFHFHRCFTISKQIAHFYSLLLSYTFSFPPSFNDIFSSIPLSDMAGDFIFSGRIGNALELVEPPNMKSKAPQFLTVLTYTT